MRRLNISYVKYGLIALVSLAVFFAIRWQLFFQSPMDLPEEGVKFEVLSGNTPRDIAASLAKKGYIQHPDLFVSLVKLKAASKRLQVGEFFIPFGTSPSELINLLVKGKVVQYPIRIGEGWTFKQIKDGLLQKKFLQHTIQNASDADIMQRLGSADIHPEGTFYPDTYHVAKGVQDVEFLKRAHVRMMRFLNHAWQVRDTDLPFNSPYEALVMASIVEKETAIETERDRIAGVFISRLQKGMRLQADPTVIYGLGDAFDGNLTKADLRRYTPYNTYRIKGLPVTPIATPSKQSIIAVMHPNRDGSLYFVATGDGGHYFSSTLKEHNIAVRKLLQKQKKASLNHGVMNGAKDVN